MKVKGLWWKYHPKRNANHQLMGLNYRIYPVQVYRIWLTSSTIFLRLNSQYCPSDYENFGSIFQNMLHLFGLIIQEIFNLSDLYFQATSVDFHRRTIDICSSLNNQTNSFISSWSKDFSLFSVWRSNQKIMFVVFVLGLTKNVHTL